MAFQFSELKIQRGPTLTRETNQVVQLFQNLQAVTESVEKPREEREEAQNMLEVLYTRIQNRIEELEDFYVEHDADDRALLFEKQRMALRRLLHVYCVKTEALTRAEAEKKTKSYPSATTQEPTPNPRRTLSKPSGNHTATSGSALKLAHSTRKKTRRRKSSISTGAPTPIYDWEKGGNEDNATGSDVALDPFEQPEVEFDIVLTEQEFFAYTSRLREYSVSQRAKKAELAHAMRRKKTTEKFEVSQNTTLQASGPYLDPQRLSRTLRRSSKKSQWIDKKGIRPY